MKDLKRQIIITITKANLTIEKTLKDKLSYVFIDKW